MKEEKNNFDPEKKSIAKNAEEISSTQSSVRKFSLETRRLEEILDNSAEEKTDSSLNENALDETSAEINIASDEGQEESQVYEGKSLTDDNQNDTSVIEDDLTDEEHSNEDFADVSHQDFDTSSHNEAHEDSRTNTEKSEKENVRKSYSVDKASDDKSPEDENNEDSLEPDETINSLSDEENLVDEPRAQYQEIYLESEEEENTKRKEKKTLNTGLWQSLKKSIASEFRPIVYHGKSPIERRRQEVLQLRRQRGAAGSLLLIHAFFLIVLTLLWQALPEEVFGINRLAINGDFFQSLFFMLISALLPSLLIFLLYKMDLSLVLGRKRHKIPSYVLSALIGLPLALAFNGINNMGLFLYYHLGMNASINSLVTAIPNFSISTIILYALIFAILPAIVEGIFFRGIVQSSLSLSGRKKLATILCATVYALYFHNPYFLLAPFLLGLYLSHIREESDNLYTSIVMQASMGCSLIFLQSILPAHSHASTFIGSRGSSIFYASLIATVVALILLLPLSNYYFQSLNNTVQSKADPIYKRLRQEQWFPADWKFMLASIVLFFLLFIIRS